ncbi:MAG: energy-coupling factor transporter transmembrane protein EcfT [Geodermatophilaceae bacterium]|nr:energy-coupling factor transporter transmembrane protein EcfT [Geodermatophilaceae bacterium]
MSPLGLYLPGSSLLHRLPAGVKLSALGVGVLALLWADRPVVLTGAAGLVVTLFAVARVPVSTAVAQLRPLFWFAIVLFGLQLLLTDLPTAAGVITRMVLTVALAALVTLTTRVTAMLDVLERVLGPLRWFGVSPERVGLVLALTIRGVPVVAGIVTTVRDAHRARGAGSWPWQLLVPVLVRVLRYADALGDALVARGFDDDAGVAR